MHETSGGRASDMNLTAEALNGLPPASSAETIVSMRGITKSFGGTRAVDNVDLDLLRAEVHGLVGENGAGKSTLMRVLAGLFTDYAGKISIRGEDVVFTTPAQAQARGIVLVHQ